MTKAQFVARLASTTGVTKADTEYMVDAIIRQISDTLAGGDDVYLPTVGRLYVGEVPAHEGSVAGKAMTFEDHRVARFRPSKELREGLNA